MFIFCPDHITSPAQTNADTFTGTAPKKYQHSVLLIGMTDQASSVLSDICQVVVLPVSAFGGGGIADPRLITFGNDLI